MRFINKHIRFDNPACKKYVKNYTTKLIYDACVLDGQY